MRRFESLKRFSVVIVSILVLAGCGRPSKLPGELDLASSEGQALDFDYVLSKIIQPKCLACHANFSSREALIASRIIVAGKPEQSPLYLRTASGEMPMGGTPLSEQEVTAIYDWISNGAIAKAPTSPNDPSGPTVPSHPADPSTPPPPGGTPSAISPTYAWIQANVFNSRCIICHRGASAPGGYDLTNYQDVISGGRVVSGNPTGSVLFQRINNNSMPPGGPALSAEVKQAIATWIQNGANNDAPVGELPPYDDGVPELPPLEPKFSSIMANIIGPRCLACHSSADPADGVSLQDYRAVMREVRAGDAKDSEFYDVLEDNEMPRSGPKLSVKEKETVRQWINLGAKND